jgi:hypothetical protein
MGLVAVAEPPLVPKLSPALATTGGGSAINNIEAGGVVGTPDNLATESVQVIYADE